MLSKVAREDEDFTPREKANSSLGYAADRTDGRYGNEKFICAISFFYYFQNSRAPSDDFSLNQCIENTFKAVQSTLDL